jgi:hypothetical protein
MARGGAPRLSPAVFALACVLSGCGGSDGPATPSGGNVSSLFDQGTLHAVDITTSARDWDTLRANFQSNTYYEADATLDGERVQRLGVRSRGSGTRNARKPALNLDFDRYVDGQRFRELESLVLENLYGDASFLHERLAFQVFEAVGLPAPQNASRGQTRFTVLPWDRDFSFSRPDWPVDTGVGRNVLVRRLLAAPAVRAQFADRVRQTLATAVNAAWLMPRIEAGYAQVRAAVREDPNKLGSDRGQDAANVQFEDAVVALRRFATEREAALRAQLP